ncbi:alpha/beta fold hydrolase [Microbacterium yannicii]|uniref:alpha/beta fold hydrolase n=1 Tax=Microbacterium yannicii TaxID=671622 RepID=UPI00036CBE92|nr:alpha/beta hydrolase [Microbacterium yannicii]
MDVILVPGLWLDASSWDGVATRLRAAGHDAHALTLRGLDSRTADRQGSMLADHVAEITAAIDRCRGPVVLVGHAESCGLVHAAVNRRPDRVARAIHVGGLPSADGAYVLSGFTLDARGTTTMTAGYRAVDATLAALHKRTQSNASHVLDQVQKLTDPRRLAVPVTLVATEFTADDIRRWMAAGIDPARELPHLAKLTIVDLPAGRWPQIECPDELSRILLEAIPAQTGADTPSTGRTPAIEPVVADS